ncbi:DEAD-domain-containing protein [Microstroma glucosiphilum]|uniref:ATP-dependent RNA helicase n=1 Tax=Pseudomicrostroma glucosiphilum TaxID=1684307 RepID=A0A316U764_9BASI|nr:DEAD-domain-containing protein [Pseudomicrostroma glucosiphilum]PWN20281.1 DEAD-domain-containing protein [Pseudomicrostroma glucosiphilum]
MAPAAVKRKRQQDGDGDRGASTPSSSKKPAVAKSRSRDSRKLKRDTEQAEIDDLESGVASFTPPKDYSRFDHLPLSRKTLQGLKKAGYSQMTDIQSRSLPLSLRSRDLLGAARTGSGKTLAFLIPVLERLFRAKWGPNDGLGALIISPTRELAIQIFEVLRRMGSAHTYSAGLVIGGKDLKQEKDRLARMNILVATPGRLLQHMDQTIGFDCSTLQVLVLDEADRILDMGFSNTLNAIVENLPKDRQTLLFSATQTKRVKDLARLSLKEPEYVAVREFVGEGKETGEGSSLTPKNLDQHYMVVPLEDKLNMLFSFLRSHTKSKLLVFFSSCRQVQFAHETFCKLRPGMSLMALHGKQKQAKRLQIFTDFTRTSHAALFATDIAARGLDFPAVDWVLQIDSPEDVDTYVHRVGRTARYQAKGNSLLFLLPSEEKAMVSRLAAKHINAGVIKPRESKTQSIQNQLQSFLFQSPELKYLAQKTFVSYVRSIYLQKDKEVFDVLALPLEKYAASLGLPGAPKVKFVKEASAARKKADAKARALEKQAASEAKVVPTEESVDQTLDGKVKTKYDRMFARQNQGVLSEHYAKLVSDERQESPDSDSDDDDDSEKPTTFDEAGAGAPTSWPGNDDDDSGADDGDFLTLKRQNHALDGSDDEAIRTSTSPVAERKDSLDTQHSEEASYQLSKRKLLQGQSKKAMASAGKRGAGTKLTFDDEGVPHELYELQDEMAFQQGGSAADQAKRFVEEEGEKLKQQDVEDKERVKEKRREKKRREKERGRGQDGSDDEDASEGGAMVLAPIDDREDGYVTPDFELDSESEEGDSDDDDDGPPEAEQATGKGRKQSGQQQQRPPKKSKIERRSAKGVSEPSNSLAADEELALRILQG